MAKLSAFRISFTFPFFYTTCFSSNRVKDSPVTLVLVISIVALYFVLLGFCVRADKHDKKKLGVVYLSENVTSAICHR